MEQLIVTNTSNEEVVVLFDGYQHVFKPGQKRMYQSGVATHIAGESESLEVGTDEIVEQVVEAPAEEPAKTMFKCKKCDFETDSKGKLLSHYKEAHKK